MKGYLVQTHRLDNSYRLYGFNTKGTALKWLTTQYNAEVEVSEVLKNNPKCFTDKLKAHMMANACFGLGSTEYKIIEVEI